MHTVWDPASRHRSPGWLGETPADPPAPWRKWIAGLSKAVTFINARVVTEAGIASSIRFRSTVLALDETPRPGDAVIDLCGAFVLPA